MVQIWKDRLVHECTNSDFISIDVLWLYIKSWSGSGSISRIENPCFILHLKLSNWELMACLMHFISLYHLSCLISGWLEEAEISNIEISSYFRTLYLYTSSLICWLIDSTNVNLYFEGRRENLYYSYVKSEGKERFFPLEFFQVTQKHSSDLSIKFFSSYSVYTDVVQNLMLWEIREQCRNNGGSAIAATI